MHKSVSTAMVDAWAELTNLKINCRVVPQHGSRSVEKYRKFFNVIKPRCAENES